MYYRLIYIVVFSRGQKKLKEEEENMSDKKRTDTSTLLRDGGQRSLTLLVKCTEHARRRYNWKVNRDDRDMQIPRSVLILFVGPNPSFWSFPDGRGSRVAGFKSRVAGFKKVAGFQKSRVVKRLYYMNITKNKIYTL